MTSCRIDHVVSPLADTKGPPIIVMDKVNNGTVRFTCCVM